MNKKWMVRILAMLLTMGMLLSGIVFAEDPAGTSVPVATEAPIAGAEPAVTEEPETTKEPAASEEPVVTEEPETTEEPAATEEPEATEEPAATEEPVMMMFALARTNVECSGEDGHEDNDNDCKCDYCGTADHAVSTHQELRDTVYAQYNHDKHTVTCKSLYVRSCNCGESYEELFVDEDAVIYEPHDEDGEDGACSKCGYVSVDYETCSHAYANGTCGNCTLCGEEYHDFDGCVCKYCSHESHDIGENCICNNCSKTIHDSWAVRTVTVYTDATYEQLNNDSHIVKGNAKIVTMCTNCQTVIKEELEIGAVEDGIEDHTDYDSCEKCGFVRSDEEVDPETCVHANVEVFKECEGPLYAVDNRYEYWKGDIYEYRWCKDCEADLDPVLIEANGIFKKEHSMRSFDSKDDLECGNCGFKASCLHDGEFETITYTQNGVCVKVDAQNHLFKGQVCEMRVCAECGWESTEFKYTYGEVELKHTFSDGMCTECGAEAPDAEACEHEYEEGVCVSCGTACPHDNVGDDTYDPVGEEYSYEMIDGAYHWKVGVPVRRISCHDCWTILEQEELKEARIRNGHVFYDWETEEESNTCAYCGYTKSAECKHEETVGKKIWLDVDYFEVEPQFVKSDAQGHHFLVAKMQDIYCADCNEYLGYEQLDTVEYVEPHNIEPGDTECICYSIYNEEQDEHTDITYEIACDHKNKQTIKQSYVEAAEYANSNDGGMWWGVFYSLNETQHILYTAITYKDYCPDCGVYIDRYDLTEPHGSYTADHEFEDDYCVYCNYKKEVKPTATATPAPTATATPEPTATATPEPTATATPEPTMPAASDDPVVKPTPTATTKPTVKPTAMPAVSDEPMAETTPEPVFVEVSETEVVSGVKIEDEIEIAETVIAIAESLEAEGEQVSMEIMNIEKVITVEEKAVLDTLTMKEQLLTFLSVIGFEDQVNDSLVATGEALSEEAMQLKQTILERVNTLDEAARTEFEKTLMESFPQETVVIDGQEYTFFVLEIEVRRGETVRIERYGFRNEDDEWILTKLEISQ